jgi:hypothetical protein
MMAGTTAPMRGAKEDAMINHVGKIIDRSPYPYPQLTVQTSAGRIVQVRVRPEDLDAAAEHYGGAWIRFVYRGGRAYYARREEEE